MSNPSIVELNQSNFKELVLDTNKLFLVDFWAPWCGPCLQIAPLLDELLVEFSGSISIGKIDVQKERELAMQYNVKGIPTILVFNNGELIATQIGLVTKDKLRELVTNSLI